MRSLFEKHGRPPGLPEDGVEKVAIELVADPSMHEWFQRAIHSTQELQLEEALAGVGLKAVLAPAAGADDKGGAEETLREKGGILETVSVADGSPAQAAGLAAGDEIVAIDGFRADLKQRLARAQPGQTVRLALFRMDELVDAPVQLAAAPRDTVTFIPDPRATPEQLAARQKWLGARWP